MTLKITLATASAIGLLMATGGAYAGSGNQVYLSQTGNSQLGTITQSSGSNDRVGSAGSFFIQEDGLGSGSNKLVINQTGSGNVTTGWQSGTTNDGKIEQDGYNSSVNLQQAGANNGSVGSAAWYNDPGVGDLILQDATANYSSVTLHQWSNYNAAKGNIFNIGQGGVGNTVTGNQTASSGGTGHNDLWIRQGTGAPDLWGWTYGDFFSPSYVSGSLGTLSYSTITVNQNSGVYDGVNYAALGQGSGTGNAITITQQGASNNADANQVGSYNVFNSQQYSSDGNTGWNFVGGEAGWPDSNVNPLTGNPGDYRPILQSGIGNEYDSYQSGSNLMAFGNQLGNYNFLSNTQSGNLNTLFSTQLGDSNQIYSVQSGDSNITTVSQVGSSNYSNTSQSGSGNTATVTQ